MPRYRLHYVDPDTSTQVDEELTVDEVVRDEGWTEFWRDGDVILRVRDEHLGELTELD